MVFTISKYKTTCHKYMSSDDTVYVYFNNLMYTNTVYVIFINNILYIYMLHVYISYHALHPQHHELFAKNTIRHESYQFWRFIW